MSSAGLRALGRVTSLTRRAFCSPTPLWPTTYKLVLPGNMSPQVPASAIPPNVALPPYAESGRAPAIGRTASPEIKSAETIARMRRTSRLAARVLREAGESLRVGMTTDELDRLVHAMCMDNDAYPSPLNYRGFPKSVCTSVSNCACHGIPDDRPLEDGDIINVDVTVFREGVHGDCSATFLIGDVDDAGRRLVSVAKACLDAGIAACGPGRPFADIGASIEKHAESHGFKVMPLFTGHGIGEFFHGPPDIYHLDGTYALQPGVMKPGMTFTVEPLISEGSEHIVILEDGWTAMSVDNSRSAQFEHTVLVTDNGCELLTLESNQ